MEAAADESFAAMRARIRFGIAMAAMMRMMATTIISSIKEKPFSLRIVPRFRLSGFNRIPASQAPKTCEVPHERNPPVTSIAKPAGSSTFPKSDLTVEDSTCDCQVLIGATIQSLVGNRVQGAASRIAGDQGDRTGRLRAKHAILVRTECFRTGGVRERRCRGVEGSGRTTSNSSGRRYCKGIAALS